MPVTSASLTRALWPSRPWRMTAFSSAVRSGTVAIRQSSTTSLPSKIPRTVLVFPTSMASSMALLVGVRWRRRPDEAADGRELLVKDQRHVVDQAGAPHPGGD